MITLQTLEPAVIDIVMPRVLDELKARYFYEAGMAWSRKNGYDKAAKYFKAQSYEEKHHYKIWVNFLSDWNVDIDFPNITPEKKEFKSLTDILEQQYQMEFNLGESYETDAIKVFPLCQITFKKMQYFVMIQNSSIIESNNLVTKAYRYNSIDPDLVLYESKIF